LRLETGLLSFGRIATFGLRLAAPASAQAGLREFLQSRARVRSAVILVVTAAGAETKDHAGGDHGSKDHADSHQYLSFNWESNRAPTRIAAETCSNFVGAQVSQSLEEVWLVLALRHPAVLHAADDDPGRVVDAVAD